MLFFLLRFYPLLAFAALSLVCLGLASSCFRDPLRLCAQMSASLFMFLTLSAMTLCMYLQFSLSLSFS